MFPFNGVYLVSEQTYRIATDVFLQELPSRGFGAALDGCMAQAATAAMAPRERFKVMMASVELQSWSLNTEGVRMASKSRRNSTAGASCLFN